MQHTELTNHNGRPVGGKGTLRPVFKIVTAYEDRDAGLRARDMVARLAVRLRSRFEVQSEVWKFELLAHPHLREYATADAAQADMLVLSASGDHELPAHVEAWVAGWPPSRRRGTTAVVALLDHEHRLTDEPPLLCAWLRQAAAQRQMDFFCKAGDWQRRDFEYTIAALPCRRDRRDAALERVLRRELLTRSWRPDQSRLSAFRLPSKAWWPDTWSFCIPKSFPWWLKAPRRARARWLHIAQVGVDPGRPVGVGIN